MCTCAPFARNSANSASWSKPFAAWDIASRIDVNRLLRSRFLWELYAGYAFIIVATAIVVGLMLVHDAERGVTDDIRDALQRDAILVRDIVIAADGRVLADSNEDPAAMDNHRDRPEIMAAANNGMGTSTRFSRTV